MELEYERKLQELKDLLKTAHRYLEHRNRDIRTLAFVTSEYAKDKIKVMENQENAKT